MSVLSRLADEACTAGQHCSFEGSNFVAYFRNAACICRSVRLGKCPCAQEVTGIEVSTRHLHVQHHLD